MNLSPIVLFVYNRPEHTLRTLNALRNNELASDSELFIYADGCKENASELQIQKVAETRNICKNITGFKSVMLNESDSNQGLAKNIITGVSEIIEKYGKVIVLEDDIITSNMFLTYMNEALNRYQNEEKVWHISGWVYPIDLEPKNKCGFHTIMNCWGWGTWKNRWQKTIFDANYFCNKFSKKDIKNFSSDYNTDFWLQMLLNKDGIYHTWAIFWYATIFEKNGLCLAPYQSLTSNIGVDGTGEHSCKNVSSETTIFNDLDIVKFPEIIQIDNSLQSKIENYIQSNNSRMLYIKTLLHKIGLYQLIRRFKKKFI